jgi:hypothetical protein
MRSGEQTTAPTTVDDTYDARTLEATEGFVSSNLRPTSAATSTSGSPTPPT